MGAVLFCFTSLGEHRITMKGVGTVCIVITFLGVASVSNAQTFTNLASFNGLNGDSPSWIIQGADGKLWGTTVAGGKPNCGTV